MNAPARASSLRAEIESVTAMSPRAAFALELSLVVSFVAGSSAPTPLYSVYAERFGFSPTTTTLVFGVYAAAVLASLLTLGSLSDRVGRKPVLVVTTLVQAVTMVIFACAPNVATLFVARVIQGLATGAAASAAGAAMLDIDKERGNLANTIGPMLGTATGGLVSGVLVQFLPWPTHLVYALFFVVFVAQAFLLRDIRETVRERTQVTLSSLRPRFVLPASARAPLLLAAPMLVASWALAGFFGSLGPTLVRRALDSRSLFLGGAALFVLAASGALCVLALRRFHPRLMMIAGSGALIAGTAVILASTHVAALSAPIFFVGAVVAGSGFGAGFTGANRSVVMLAAPAERAGVLSVLYTIAYLSMGTPAVIAGLRVARGVGVVDVVHEYGAAVIVLAGSALCGALLSSRRAHAS